MTSTLGPHVADRNAPSISAAAQKIFCYSSPIVIFFVRNPELPVGVSPMDACAIDSASQEHMDRIIARMESELSAVDAAHMVGSSVPGVSVSLTFAKASDFYHHGSAALHVFLVLVDRKASSSRTRRAAQVAREWRDDLKKTGASDANALIFLVHPDLVDAVSGDGALPPAFPREGGSSSTDVAAPSGVFGGIFGRFTTSRTAAEEALGVVEEYLAELKKQKIPPAAACVYHPGTYKDRMLEALKLGYQERALHLKALRHQCHTARSAPGWSIQEFWRKGLALSLHHLQFGALHEAISCFTAMFTEYYNQSDDFGFCEDWGFLRDIGQVPNMLDPQRGHQGARGIADGVAPAPLADSAEPIDGLLYVVGCEMTCSLLLGNREGALARFASLVEVVKEKFADSNRAQSSAHNRSTSSSLGGGYDPAQMDAAMRRGRVPTYLQHFFLFRCCMSALDLCTGSNLAARVGSLAQMASGGHFSEIGIDSATIAVPADLLRRSAAAPQPKGSRSSLRIGQQHAGSETQAMQSPALAGSATAVFDDDDAEVVVEGQATENSVVKQSSLGESDAAARQHSPTDDDATFAYSVVASVVDDSAAAAAGKKRGAAGGSCCASSSVMQAQKELDRYCTTVGDLCVAARNHLTLLGALLGLRNPVSKPIVSAASAASGLFCGAPKEPVVPGAPRGSPCRNPAPSAGEKCLLHQPNAPRCGGPTKAGGACQIIVISNGVHCRYHGGARSNEAASHAKQLGSHSQLRQWLALSCLRSEPFFDATFLGITRVAASSYRKGKRAKQFHALLTDEAAVLVTVDPLKAAELLRRVVVPYYASSGWHALLLRAKALFVESVKRLLNTYLAQRLGSGTGQSGIIATRGVQIGDDNDDNDIEHDTNFLLLSKHVVTDLVSEALTYCFRLSFSALTFDAFQSHWQTLMYLQHAAAMTRTESEDTHPADDASGQRDSLAASSRRTQEDSSPAACCVPSGQPCDPKLVLPLTLILHSSNACEFHTAGASLDRGRVPQLPTSNPIYHQQHTAACRSAASDFIVVSVVKRLSAARIESIFERLSQEATTLLKRRKSSSTFTARSGRLHAEQSTSAEPQTPHGTPQGGSATDSTKPVDSWRQTLHALPRPKWSGMTSVPRALIEDDSLRVVVAIACSVDIIAHTAASVWTGSVVLRSKRRWLVSSEATHILELTNLPVVCNKALGALLLIAPLRPCHAGVYRIAEVCLHLGTNITLRHEFEWQNALPEDHNGSLPTGPKIDLRASPRASVVGSVDSTGTAEEVDPLTVLVVPEPDVGIQLTVDPIEPPGHCFGDSLSCVTVNVAITEPLKAPQARRRGSGGSPGHSSDDEDGSHCTPERGPQDRCRQRCCFDVVDSLGPHGAPQTADGHVLSHITPAKSRSAGGDDPEEDLVVAHVYIGKPPRRERLRTMRMSHGRPSFAAQRTQQHQPATDSTTPNSAALGASPMAQQPATSSFLLDNTTNAAAAFGVSNVSFGLDASARDMSSLFNPRRDVSDVTDHHNAASHGQTAHSHPYAPRWLNLDRASLQLHTLRGGSEPQRAAFMDPLGTGIHRNDLPSQQGTAPSESGRRGSRVTFAPSSSRAEVQNGSHIIKQPTVSYPDNVSITIIPNEYATKLAQCRDVLCDSGDTSGHVMGTSASLSSGSRRIDSAVVVEGSAHERSGFLTLKIMLRAEDANGDDAEHPDVSNMRSSLVANIGREKMLSASRIKLRVPVFPAHLRAPLTSASQPPSVSEIPISFACQRLRETSVRQSKILFPPFEPAFRVRYQFTPFQEKVFVRATVENVLPKTLLWIRHAALEVLPASQCSPDLDDSTTDEEPGKVGFRVHRASTANHRACLAPMQPGDAVGFAFELRLEDNFRCTRELMAHCVRLCVAYSSWSSFDKEGIYRLPLLHQHDTVTGSVHSPREGRAASSSSLPKLTLTSTECDPTLGASVLDDGAATLFESRSPSRASSSRAQLSPVRKYLTVDSIRELFEATSCNVFVANADHFVSKHLCTFNIMVLMDAHEDDEDVALLLEEDDDGSRSDPPSNEDDGVADDDASSKAATQLRRKRSSASIDGTLQSRRPSSWRDGARSADASGGASGGGGGDSRFYEPGEPMHFRVVLHPQLHNWPAFCSRDEDRFFVSLEVNPSEWMVVGRQRQLRTLSSTTEEQHCFFVALPVASGAAVSLPGVSVHHARVDPSTSETHMGDTIAIDVVQCRASIRLRRR